MAIATTVNVIAAYIAILVRNAGQRGENGMYVLRVASAPGSVGTLVILHADGCAAMTRRSPSRQSQGQPADTRVISFLFLGLL